MHYIYLLEGRLKYEKIEFESAVTFTLYSDKKSDSVSGDDLVYFIKSEIDVVITINLSSSKISLSTPLSNPILLFTKDGKMREIVSDREVSLTNDVVKFKIADLDFSFLINSMVDPAKDVLGDSKKKKFNIADYKKHILASVIVVFTSVVIYTLLSGKKDDKESSALVFNNEFDLMRANLSNINSSEILVKTRLRDEVKIFLEKRGYRYVRFDLEEQKKDKFNLILYVFQNETQPFDSLVSQISWITSVVVKKVRVDQMMSDLKRLTDKYGLNTIDDMATNMRYQLIEVSFVNNNLTFNSLQRDLSAFYQRWGKHYIEFNINLKQQKDLPINFILKDGDIEVIKSKDGFYFN